MVSHFMIALAIWAKNGEMVLLFMLAFQMTLNSCIGTVHWLYVGEVLNDKQLGLVATLHYAQGAIIAMVTEYLIKWLDTTGLFVLLGLISVLYFSFLQKFFKETKDLTDKEKKALYIPSKFLIDMPNNQFPNIELEKGRNIGSISAADDSVSVE